MSVFDMIMWALAFLASVSAWFFLPDMHISWKISIVLIIIVLFFITNLVHLHVQHKKLKERYDKLAESHKAIARRLDRNRYELELYKSAFISLECSINVAIQTSGRDKISKLYEGLLKIKETILNKEGHHYE